MIRIFRFHGSARDFQSAFVNESYARRRRDNGHYIWTAYKVQRFGPLRSWAACVSRPYRVSKKMKGRQARTRTYARNTRARVRVFLSFFLLAFRNPFILYECRIKCLARFFRTPDFTSYLSVRRCLTIIENGNGRCGIYTTPFPAVRLIIR